MVLRRIALSTTYVTSSSPLSDANASFDAVFSVRCAAEKSPVPMVAHT
jgi:hypothetical protein